MILSSNQGDWRIYNQGEGTGLLLMAEVDQEKKCAYCRGQRYTIWQL